MFRGRGWSVGGALKYDDSCWGENIDKQSLELERQPIFIGRLSDCSNIRKHIRISDGGRGGGGLQLTTICLFV